MFARTPPCQRSHLTPKRKMRIAGRHRRVQPVFHTGEDGAVCWHACVNAPFEGNGPDIIPQYPARAQRIHIKAVDAKRPPGRTTPSCTNTPFALSGCCSMKYPGIMEEYPARVRSIERRYPAVLIATRLGASLRGHTV